MLRQVKRRGNEKKVRLGWQAARALELLDREDVDLLFNIVGKPYDPTWIEASLGPALKRAAA